MCSGDATCIRMDRPPIDHGIEPHPGNSVARQTRNVELTAGWTYAALIIVLSAWVLHSFLEALLAACVTAIASWPL